jgi:antitoxin component YwqK of YwqJK toxin-antitoxin module
MSWESQVFIKISSIILFIGFYAPSQTINNKSHELVLSYEISTKAECKDNETLDWVLASDKGLVVYCTSNGVKNGVWKKLYLNGKVKVRANYKNGVLHGARETYYENGVISGRINYWNGKATGLWLSKDESGNIRLVGSVIKGCNVGVWVVFDEYKQPVIFTKYKNCKVIKPVLSMGLVF